MRLVACPSCHTQYDVTDVGEKQFRCRCGETVENRPHAAVEAQIHRCGACGALVAADASSCTYCGAEIIRDSGQLSLICPECYGRNAEEARFCGVCGVRFDPHSIDFEGEELPCPVCSCLMPPRQVAGIGVNECPQCNGLWVPGTRFEALVRKAVEARQAQGPLGSEALAPRATSGNPVTHAVHYRKCPVCDAFMHRRNWMKTSGVVIDRCNDHGVWLDVDELEQIAGFVLSGGLERRTEERQVARLHFHDPEDDPKVREISAAFERIRSRHQRNREGGLLGSLADLFDDLLS